MSQVSDIMWYLSFSDSSSSEIISWLWGETLHTQHSLCLSLFLRFQSKDHTCTQDNVCKDDCGVFLGGGFVLPEKVDNLAS